MLEDGIHVEKATWLKCRATGFFGQASAQGPANASEFDNIVAALSDAKQVTLIVNFSGCKDPKGSSTAQIQTGLKIQSFMVIGRDQIVFL